MENWQNLPKNQDDNETIEGAIARNVTDHESDPDAHLGASESLQSHKASKVIDHIARSIVGDKINNIDTVLCHDHLSEIATVETIGKTKRVTFNHTPDDSFDTTDRAAYFLTGTGAGKLLTPYGQGDIQIVNCESTETWTVATNYTGYHSEGANSRYMTLTAGQTKEAISSNSPIFPFNMTAYLSKKIQIWVRCGIADANIPANSQFLVFRDNTGKKRNYNITSQVVGTIEVLARVNLNAYTQDTGFNEANIVSVAVKVTAGAGGGGSYIFDDIRIVMDDTTKTSYTTLDVGALSVGDELFFTKVKVHQPEEAPVWSKTDINAINGHSVKIIWTDAYIEFTKECDRVEIYGSKGAWYGIIDVYVDGVLDSTVDLYQDMVDSMLPVFEKAFETTAVRTFKIVLTGDMNPSSNDSAFALSGIDTNGIIDISSVRLLKMTTYHYFAFDDPGEQTVTIEPPTGYEVYAPTGTRALSKIDSVGGSIICEQYVEGGSGFIRVEPANTGEEIEGEAHWLIVKNDNIWENTSE